MRTHQDIDRRSLALAAAVVSRIDADPDRAGLRKARQTCERWLARRASPAALEWMSILQRPWKEIRSILLDPGSEGQRLRQSDPFCGILTPEERWRIYREFRDQG
ncbi:MAG: hypothetical protein ACYCW6_22070 [Candidatus Xenobia bacterium]